MAGGVAGSLLSSYLAEAMVFLLTEKQRVDGIPLLLLWFVTEVARARSRSPWDCPLLVSLPLCPLLVSWCPLLVSCATLIVD